MITYVFLGITLTWIVVSAIVGAFQVLMGQSLDVPSFTAGVVSAPTSPLFIVSWVITSVGFFFKMFGFQITGAELLSSVWIFMGIAWIYCLIRIIHTGGI